MDQGPIDAGPYTDSGYDNPTRSPSPEAGRLKSRRRAELRSPSSKRRNEATLPEDFDPSDSSSSRPRDESPPAFEDRPTFVRIGATAEELESGEIISDTEKLREHCDEDKHWGPGSCRVYRYTLYETNARCWITGADLAEKVYRLLRIDRTSPPGQVGLFEDGTTYNLRQIQEVLTSIDEGNKATGGLRKQYQFWGVLGFIRFTEAYYMLIITKRQQVAMIGGHYVYQIEGTELVSLTTSGSSRFAPNRNPEEARFVNIFNNLDLSKGFYFSYAYDVTNSLQHNMIRQRQALNDGRYQASHKFNSMFVWNHHLLKPAISALKHPFVWCLPIIHGFIDQAALDIFGRAVYIAVIGRRSRLFAGARFLKRGVNDQGYVANDVETEQIVAEKITTSFHAPGGRLYSNPTYTSFVQHRGSIPLFWTQDNSGVSPKPDINLNLQDPFYQPAALHFDNLFERYGCPVYVLNLIKARERTPRESKLLIEFQKCINYLNQSLPTDKKILYKAFDMSRASKTHGGDVIGSLELIAREIVGQTGIFRNGDDNLVEPQLQNGVARTNCIDCLDRTNAAQFVFGKRAFALQLQALGVIDRDEVAYDTDAVNIFTHMFHDHGDTIAVQYGGSHLVNTMATYRKLNHWQSSSRDMVESFKRYYHNSFLDNQRQEAYNLFLGNYIWAQGQPMLWDLTTDYYLHHSDPRAWLQRQRKNYITWYTPAYLEPKVLPRSLEPGDICVEDKVDEYDDYWKETYRPTILTTLGRAFPFRITSSTHLLPERLHHDSTYDYSPFKIRVDPHRQQTADTPDKRAAQRKEAAIVGGSEKADAFSIDIDRDHGHGRRPTSVPELDQPQGGPEGYSLSRVQTEPTRHVQWRGAPARNGATIGTISGASDKVQQHLLTLNQLHTRSLRPAVSDNEALEYRRYIDHPHHLPLVVSNELPSDANIEYIEYVHKAGGALDAEHPGVDPSVIACDVDDADIHQFWEFLRLREDPLTVTDDDGGQKRYKAYRQWLRGKSLFKQSKVDPEFRAGV